MKKSTLVLMLVLSLFSAEFALGKTEFMTEEALKADAEIGYGQILDLWHDGKYAELYERTTVGGKNSREDFIQKMANAPYKPACCWEKLQDVRATVKGEEKVIIRAKVGLQGAGATTFKTRDVKLTREDGLWRISQADIITLSGASKKKAYGKKKKKRVYRH